MIEQRKANVAKRGHIYQTTFSQSHDNFIDQIPSETPIGDPYMDIDTPSDEFYNINTNQSGPPMCARHKLQPRLLRTNPNTKQNTFPKKPARQKMDWSYISTRTYIQTFQPGGKRCSTKVQCRSNSEI